MTLRTRLDAIGLLLPRLHLLTCCRDRISLHRNAASHACRTRHDPYISDHRTPKKGSGAAAFTTAPE
jgi:hypothetical protein